MANVEDLTAKARSLQDRAQDAKERRNKNSTLLAVEAHEQFKQTRIHLARAVYRIKTDGLYKDTELSWADFAQQKLGMSRNHANTLVHITRIRQELFSRGVKNLPTKLSQVKALRPYEGTELKTVWNRAIQFSENPSRTDVNSAAAAVL